jgi:DNA-packaging protein gp3
MTRFVDDKDLVANQLWRQRDPHDGSGFSGVRKFETPQELWDAAVGYFEWVEENPLYEMKAFAFQGVVTQEPVPKMRAMTIAGLCLFIGIARGTFQKWGYPGDKEFRPDLYPVIQAIRDVIYEQKFTGAASDLFNAGLIARDLGLADKTELTGADGGPIQTEDKTKRDAADFASQLSRLAAAMGAGDLPVPADGRDEGGS